MRSEERMAEAREKRLDVGEWVKYLGPLLSSRIGGWRTGERGNGGERPSPSPGGRRLRHSNAQRWKRQKGRGRDNEPSRAQRPGVRSQCNGALRQDDRSHFGVVARDRKSLLRRTPPGREFCGEEESSRSGRGPELQALESGNCGPQRGKREEGEDMGSTHTRPFDAGAPFQRRSGHDGACRCPCRRWGRTEPWGKLALDLTTDLYPKCSIWRAPCYDGSGRRALGNWRISCCVV